MKIKINLIVVAIIATLLLSCSSVNYFYQVYKVVPTDELKIIDNSLVWEDNNCKISYNLWNDGGEIGFSLYNKTDDNIYLNLDESFYILNGIAYNYFKNRIFTVSTGTGTTVPSSSVNSKTVNSIYPLGMMQSAGYSVTYVEEKIVCIPSKTAKIISEYNINETLYRDCDLFKYPTKSEIKMKSFTKDDSPFVLSNRISYSVGKSEKTIKFENIFYVSEICNYPEREFYNISYEEYCGQKSSTLIKTYKYNAPDKFYLKYVKNYDFWKH